jgi:biopolymer transport protein ExbB
MQAADALIRKGDYLGLLAVSNRHNEAIASVMERALNFLTKNPTASMAEVREIAQAEGIRLASLWNQRISYLADIGSIAPMRGLLGTVLGMISTFLAFEQGGNYAMAGALSGGMWQALLSVAGSLLLAIPAHLAHHFLASRVRSIVRDMEWSGNEMMRYLQTEYRSVAPAAGK